VERFQLEHTCVYKCLAPACQLRFSEPQLADEALADAYRRLYYPGKGRPAVLENTPREVILQAFQGFRERLGELAGNRLLDYGCGTGALSKIAREFGLAPVGIEQDSEARREIERQSQFPVYPNLDSLERREPHSRFHLIILWQAVEHLRRPWDDLARLRGLLAPNGWLVAATPNADGMKARIRRSRWDNYANPTHFYYFTRRSLRAVFERAGFSPVEEWRFNMTYLKHGPFRRGLHTLLATTRLDGDLILAGGSRVFDAGDKKTIQVYPAKES
jgi:2-polyprenyl-3-methyl-5-hydroxy-6-metoxy-1,4-benzoquinol methylase